MAAMSRSTSILKYNRKRSLCDISSPMGLIIYLHIYLTTIYNIMVGCFGGIRTWDEKMSVMKKVMTSKITILKFSFLEQWYGHDVCENRKIINGINLSLTTGLSIKMKHKNIITPLKSSNIRMEMTYLHIFKKFKYKKCEFPKSQKCQKFYFVRFFV